MKMRKVQVEQLSIWDRVSYASEADDLGFKCSVWARIIDDIKVVRNLHLETS